MSDTEASDAVNKLLLQCSDSMFVNTQTLLGSCKTIPGMM